ncbi:SAM-dependent methyltransferase [Hyunsoonleella flava]|uniref:SAM-dependent methyltransferase n=1 Tax=Hyunsoonleella flava TaxID=2527939 RepID=A0A4Q9FJ43_9FLAO|nr:tRNA (5-methylaminomethyl-2-thiouridine)(34)-methyltransferase MnmD [Hyunsoonleella flava]TBN06615.1 SAM-dependent methyltransferase [Hyunsoonleella flava]
MKREIITTADGSSTIHLPDWNEQYHSKHGAIQEAYHVFIKHGLHHFCHSERSEESQEIAILEIGFGTGLNAFITYLETENSNIKIDYVGVEGYPVSNKEIELLNYTSELKQEGKDQIFKMLHNCSWEDKHRISRHFTLAKQQKMFDKIDDVNAFNLIYFDAFGARVQPELWTEAIFKIMYTALKQNGVLVTYAAKGSVRRAMEAVEFTVERLPGPPGKREMLRATK